MSDPVKWGVMGNANIARVCVIPAIQTSRNSTVHALATRSATSAARIASVHHIRHVYESYEALTADPEIDVVYIPLPNHLHYPWTLTILESGKHVLCEKPLACNAGQARKMADTAADRGLLLMEAFMYRFHPRTRRIKEMVSAGAIGTPRLVRSSFCYHMGEELLKQGECARLQPTMGGGALLDVGCYGVSVTRWLLGAEPSQVQAQAVYHPCGVDVHFAGLLRFPQGELGILEASFISALQQTYSVVGSEGAIELPHNAFIPWEEDALFTLRGKEQERGEEHVMPGVDQYRVMVEHFADAVLGASELPFPPAESVRNMLVLDALAEAAQTGKVVNL
jgi:predicted dehydrogenase